MLSVSNGDLSNESGGVLSSVTIYDDDKAISKWTVSGEQLLAMLVILILWPLFLFILAVLCFSKGTVIYRQNRIGLGGEVFQCLKFRTMSINADEILHQLLISDPVAAAEWSRNHKLTRDPRVTFFGRILRATSLDELPQLFNIASGEMSFIGPRPIVAAEIAKYGRQFRFYVSVRPGLTGLWQVSGRSDTSYSRRIALDRFYVSHQNWRLNTLIMFRSVTAVISTRGAR